MDIKKDISHKLVHFSGFEEFIANNKDKSLKELYELSGGRLSSTSICRGLKAIGYSYKKTFYHPKKMGGSRAKFIEDLKKLSQEQLVFLDESGIEDNACLEYGWSP